MKLQILGLILLSTVIISEGYSDSEEHDIHEDEIIENEEKIQGGKLSNIKKHPYMISIQKEGETEGAAFIINKRWALTAAFHFWGFTNGSLTFRVGSSLASKGRKVHVKSFFTHPGYYGRWKDDLAVFKLTKPLPLSKTIRPIGLASSLPKNGSLATTCGWGYQKWGFKTHFDFYDPSLDVVRTTALLLELKFCESVERKEKQIYRRLLDDAMIITADFNFYVWPAHKSSTIKDDKNDTLRTTTVKYTESKSCLDFYPGELNEGNFCSLTEGKSPCVFDWGAPLVFKGKAFGLFVGGHGCGSLQNPPVYIDLTKYKKWINYIIKKH